MNRMKQTQFLVLALAVLVLTLPTQAHAYLDPGTGSYAVQIIIASTVGGLYALKMYGRNFAKKVRTFFKKEDK